MLFLKVCGGISVIARAFLNFVSSDLQESGAYSFAQDTSTFTRVRPSSLHEHTASRTGRAKSKCDSQANYNNKRDIMAVHQIGRSDPGKEKCKIKSMKRTCRNKLAWLDSAKACFFPDGPRVLTKQLTMSTNINAIHQLHFGVGVRQNSVKMRNFSYFSKVLCDFLYFYRKIILQPNGFSSSTSN